jgi:hypothetical protein
VSSTSATAKNSVVTDKKHEIAVHFAVLSSMMTGTSEVAKPIL